MSENISETDQGIWQQIVDTQIFDQQPDQHVKKFIINMLTNYSNEEILGLQLDTSSIIDKENQYLCFFVACMFYHQHDGPRIIQRLVDDFQIDVNHIDKNGENCLTLGCWKNTNLDVIKYLINDLKMDINWMNNDGDNCLIGMSREQKS